MSASQIDRALRILKMERHLTTAEQFESWVGRRDAARSWLEECEGVLRALLDSPSSFEMDVIVEPTAPATADPLPGEPESLQHPR